MLTQRREVMRRAVALVGSEPVYRKHRIPFANHAIAFDLGQDGSGSDGRRKRITMNDGLLRQFAIQAYGIDQQMVGAGIEPQHRLTHCDTRGLVDINLVDAGGVHRGDGPSDSVLADALGQYLAAFRAQQLGIAQSSNAISGIEDDSGSNYRSKQRAPSDLVHPRHQMRAQPPGFFLILQRATQLLEQAKLGGGRREWFLGREFGLRRHGPSSHKRGFRASSLSLAPDASVENAADTLAATAIHCEILREPFSATASNPWGGYGRKLTLPPRLANFEPNLESRSYPLGGSVLTEEPSNPSLERSTKRIHVALPIRVTYWDGANKPCLEMACTYDISAQGARVSSLRCVKEAGEIIAVERGRSRAFCRVVWIGEANSELRGQIGIQCLESDRAMWEGEMRDMEEAYDPIVWDCSLSRTNPAVGSRGSNRRRHERFDVRGLAELLREGPTSVRSEAALTNLSELGCQVTTKQVLNPDTDLKLVLNVGSYDLSVRGKVRHASREEGLGIEFREIRKGDRQILQFLLRKLAEKQLEDLFQLEI
jgi:hypothetical protein